MKEQRIKAGLFSKINVNANLVDVQEWNLAYERWMIAKSPNSQRAYLAAWISFLDSLDGRGPWEVTYSDAAAWVAKMQAQGASARTINQRLAAISGFYEYVCTEFIVVDHKGRHPLHDTNPAAGRSLRRRQGDDYDQADGLNGQQVRALLRAIPKDTVQGLRDYALFLLYTATGRRNSEIRCLRKCDFRLAAGSGAAEDGTVQFWWENKGSSGWDECPPDVLEALKAYLDASERPWDTLPEDAYIFIALDDRAARLPNVRRQAPEQQEPGQQPLSMRQVGALLKRYARRAGLEASRVHVHSLRHTTAGLMEAVGEDLREIQAQLGHKNLRTTQVYLEKRRGRKNRFWAKVKALYGL